MDWVFPADIRGWLSEVEGRKLADLARDRRVLEIGSFCGRSAVCMAQTADSLTCIDPFDGRATSSPGDTRDEFIANLERYKPHIINRVVVHRGTTDDVAPGLCAANYDLVFIDGAHDYASVVRDIRAVEPLLAPGGILAFHDYRKHIDPDVERAVDDYLKTTGAELLEVCDSLAVVRPAVRDLPAARPATKTKPLVFLGMPSYNGQVACGAAEAFYLAPTFGACDVVRSRANSSFLTKTFNDLWCAALNARRQGVTHFAMIHADITPEHGWIDKLLGELIRLDADIVSAISPIKTNNGLTSTAIAADEGPWLRRRLTMKEVYRLPETFCERDVKRVLGYDGPLLLNTGLWVCRLDRPWAEEVCFDVFNRIVRKDGDWHAEAIPEDWLLSAATNRLGCKLYATRKVTLTHEGSAEYATDRAWGLMDTDEVYLEIAKKRGLHAADQVHAGLSGEGCGVAGEEERAADPAGV